MGKTTIKRNDNEWKYIGQTTGANAIDFPSKWKELCTVVFNGTNHMTAYHLYESQTDGYTIDTFGNFGTSYAIGNIRKTSGALYALNWSGQDVLSSAKTYWYYR